MYQDRNQVQGTQVVHTTHVVNTNVDAKVVDYPEENDFHYQQERSSYIQYVKNFGIVSILVSIIHVVLAVLLYNRDPRGFSIGLLVAAVLFLVNSILATVWAFQKEHATAADGQHLHPKGDVHDNNLTKVVYIAGLLLSGTAVFLFVNLHVQFNTPIHYIEARESPKHYVEQTVGILIATSAIMVLHFCYNLLTARASFRTMRNTNEAMSYALYLGVTLLFAFSMALTLTVQKVGYELDDHYSALQTNFPMWVLKGLWVVGIALSVLAVMGLLINFRRWRVGYFALAFLILVGLVMLVHLVGYSYRQKKAVAHYYSDSRSYYERLYDTHRDDIHAYGCPDKYVDISTSVAYDVWEDVNDHARKKLNPDCAGLLGDMYSEWYVAIANWGLLSLLSCALISIACYFFWYVSWFNASTHHKREFFWFGLVALTAIGYIIAYCLWWPTFYQQRTVVVTSVPK